MWFNLTNKILHGVSLDNIRSFSKLTDIPLIPMPGLGVARNIDFWPGLQEWKINTTIENTSWSMNVLNNYYHNTKNYLKVLELLRVESSGNSKDQHLLNDMSNKCGKIVRFHRYERAHRSSIHLLRQEILNQNFPAGPVDRNLLAMDSIPGLGRSYMLWSN